MNSTQPDIPALRRELLADLQAVVQIGELTVEDFGPLHARYARLRTLGVEFAPEFVLLMALLERQAMHTDDDPDSDTEVDDGGEDDRDSHQFGQGDSFTWLRDGEDAECPWGYECDPLMTLSNIEMAKACQDEPGSHVR